MNSRFLKTRVSPLHRFVTCSAANLLLVSCSLLIGSPASSSVTAAAAEPERIDFAHDVAPLLSKHCGQCHTGEKQQGGFSMNTRASLLKGGESGAAVVSGKSAASGLIARVVSMDSELRMPPEGPRLSDKQVQTLKRWIDEGAAWEEGFTFEKSGYEPPLKLQRPTLPPPLAGRDHPIDRLLDHYVARNSGKRVERLADGAFVRRASLDIVGLLPTAGRVREFAASQDGDKHRQYVEELLDDHTAYAEHWLSFWNDLLRNDYTGTGFITGGRKQITSWLYRSLLENKPYDQFVRELIAPTSDSEGFIQGIRWRGNVSASQTPEVQFAQSICQSFLGINMKCASCHDSFIDRWKLDEAYGLAAIVSDKPLEIFRCDKPTGRQATAAWIFPELGSIDARAPRPARLQQLAALMTHTDNGRFSRTIVNRLWHRLMGRGIVHPTDAMHTAPWYPELLEFLAIDLVDHQFDLKQTIALICTSQAYQSRSLPLDHSSEDKDYVYAGPVAKRMTAEQFMDAVWQITGSAPTKFDAPITRGSSAAPPRRATGPRGQSTKSGRGDNTEPKPSAQPTPIKNPSWIWSYAEASSKSPGRESITLRRRFTIDQAPTTAEAVITCDNSYTLWVNGKKLAGDNDWNSVELVDLKSSLRAGANEIVILAINGGEGLNPAGLIFAARWNTPTGDKATSQSLVSDVDWEWTATPPNDQGVLPADAQWQAAVAVENQKVWGESVQPDGLARHFQQALSTNRMVRASLVKLDALMRTLGRPNRDQIVTMRPAELTTLEAIDLANAQSLADLLAQGAARWQQSGPPRLGDSAAPATDATQAIIDYLYEHGLARRPTAAETAQLREMLGDKPSAAAIEDAMWAVFMLPEFQLVR
jgi:hypothetical protein